MQPTRNDGRADPLLLDFAPDEVYHADPVTRIAVGSYPTFSPLPKIHFSVPKAVSFLWHFLSLFSARVLPGVMLSGARTFLRRYHYRRR